MRIHKSLFGTLAIAAFISACTFTSTRLNREEDRDAAEKVANKLFGLLKSKNYDATYSLFSDSLWVNTTKDQLKTIYTYSDGKLGDMKVDSLSSWQTKIVTGTAPSAQYELIYQNQYQKGTAKVDILLTQERGKIKILGYHINSDLFLAK